MDRHRTSRSAAGPQPAAVNFSAGPALRRSGHFAAGLRTADGNWPRSDSVKRQSRAFRALGKLALLPRARRRIMPPDTLLTSVLDLSVS
jgi:hypothetical protein